MRPLPLFYLLILQFLFSTVTFSQTFNLAISGGIGNGTYNEGDTVHVWSKAIFGDSVFTQWTGSATTYLTFDNEWHTTLIVPVGSNVGNLTLAANFDKIPTATQIGIDSFLLFGVDSMVGMNVIKEVHFAIPPNPKGIVFLLHGTNGSGASFFDGYERFALVKDLVYDGFAAVALNANEITLGDQNGDTLLRWFTSNAPISNELNNVDIKNILALKDTLINQFGLPSTIPCFSVGMSNGAVFGDIVASALGFKATAHVNANGIPQTYKRPDIAPVIWVMSENDNNENSDPVIAMANFDTMSLVQIAEWHSLRRSPAYPSRFIRSLNGISLPKSTIIFNKMLLDGYLNADHYLTYFFLDSIPSGYLNQFLLDSLRQIDVFTQWRCLNGDHTFASDFNKNIIRFFNERLTMTSVESEVVPKASNIKLFPNPMERNAVLIFENPNFKSHTLQIFNIKGRLVRTISNIQNDMISIKRENLVSGIYFLLLSSKDQVFVTEKLIIH